MFDKIKNRLAYRLLFIMLIVVLVPISITAYFIYDIIAGSHEENIERILGTGQKFIDTSFSQISDIVSANSVRVKDDHRFYKALRDVAAGRDDGAGMMNFLRSGYDFDGYLIKCNSTGLNLFFSDRIKENRDTQETRDTDKPVISFTGGKFIVTVRVKADCDENEYIVEFAKEIEGYNIYEVSKSLGFEFSLLDSGGKGQKTVFTTIFDSYGKPAAETFGMYEPGQITGKVTDFSNERLKRKVLFFEPFNFSPGFIGAVSLVEDQGYLNAARNHFMIMLMIFAILLLILGYVIRDQIVDPVADLLEGIGNVSTQIEKDQPIEPLDVRSAGEIGRLAEEFNRMATSLGVSFSRIKYLQNYLLNIFESMPSGLIAVDNHGKITQWNRTAEKYTDSENNIYAGEEVWNAVKDLKLYKEELLKYINERDHIELSREPVRDGERKSLNIHMFPLVANGVKGSVIRIDDITELKKKEEQLIQAQKMETIGTLAGGIAHDFNNILSGIVGVVSILKYRIDRKIDIPQEQLAEYLDIMEKSGKRAGDIVQRLLTLSRKQNTLMEKVTVSEVVSQVVKICSNTFDKRVEITCSDPESRASVMADFTQLEQVILNLAINAYHAMTIMRSGEDEYGGKLIFGIRDKVPEEEIERLVSDRNTEYMCVSVKDTGIGMDSSVIKQIFEPFFSTKEKGLGTGLGLTIVFNIVQQFGGTIDIDSEPGKGTDFRLYFPVSRNGGVSEGTAHSNSVMKGSGTILVIDDEPVLRELAASMLGQAGYTVIKACNGKEGVSIFRDNHKEIKLVLLDMIMPVLDGKETFRELKKIDRNVRVIMASGFSKDNRIGEVIKMGARDFIQKPYTIYDLTSKVHGALENGNGEKTSSRMD